MRVTIEKAGINGEGAARTLTLDLARLAGTRSGTLITDGRSERFEKQTNTLGADRKLSLTLPPSGGFVLVFD